MHIYLLDINTDMVNEWKKASAFRNNGNITIVNDNFKHFMDTHNNIIDGIVSPANSYGVMDGGYDKAIIDYLGQNAQTNIFTLLDVKHDGYQPVGSCMAGWYGKYTILHTPTMRVPEEIIDPRVIYDCMYSCLSKAKMCRLKAIVIPAFGACTGKVPLNTVAELMSFAYTVFNNKQMFFGDNPNLHNGCMINKKLKEIINKNKSPEDLSCLYSGSKINGKIDDVINAPVSNDLTITGECVIGKLATSNAIAEINVISEEDKKQINLLSKEEYIKNNSHMYENNFGMQVEYSEPKYKCPKCNEGGMRKNLTMVLTSLPPKYSYKCDKCGHVEYHEF